MLDKNFWRYLEMNPTMVSYPRSSQDHQLLKIEEGVDERIKNLELLTNSGKMKTLVKMETFMKRLDARRIMAGCFDY